MTICYFSQRIIVIFGGFAGHRADDVFKSESVWKHHIWIMAWINDTLSITWLWRQCVHACGAVELLLPAARSLTSFSDGLRSYFRCLSEKRCDERLSWWFVTQRLRRKWVTSLMLGSLFQHAVFFLSSHQCVRPVVCNLQCFHER